MRRRFSSLLIIFLCLLTLAGLYVALVTVEFYWNVPDWRPRWDAASFMLLWVGCASTVILCVIVVLVPRGTGCLVALVACVLLASAAVYLFPAEPLNPGFLGRNTASPVWYRTGRSLLLSLPIITWVARGVTRRRRSRN